MTSDQETCRSWTRELILANVLRAQPIRRGPKVLGKLGDTAEIGLERL
jgi:hypothetical protein